MNVNWYKSRETVLFLFAEAVAGLSFFHSSLYELCVCAVVGSRLLIGRPCSLLHTLSFK